MNVKELLQKMLQAGISDMHFKAGSPPILRVNGTSSNYIIAIALLKSGYKIRS